MGVKKHNRAEELKKARKKIYYAKLNNCPTSPRKMRLAAGLIRGINIENALHILKNSSLEASIRLLKLLLSAIANWQNKNEWVIMEDKNLFVKEIAIDSAMQLKRLRTAPHGRAHRIRKRSNHVTLIIDSKTID